MKQYIAALTCIVLLGCSRDGAEAPKPPEPPVPPAAPEAPQPPQAPAAPEGSAAAIVPVGDDNRLNIPPAIYPPLAGRFTDAAAITPRGWRVEYRVEGDLNGDRRSDLVLVLRQQNAANVINNDGLGGERLDTNPRLLVVGLAGQDGYRLAVANHSFIPRHLEPTLSDALEQSPEIRNGVLSITLNYFASAGGWTMSNATSRFRWQDNGLRLIGHDYSEVQRNTGETLDRSVNFLTRRVSTTTSNIEADKDPAPVWTRLADGPLLTINQVGDGLEFSPVAPD